MSIFYRKKVYILIIFSMVLCHQPVHSEPFNGIQLATVDIVIVPQKTKIDDKQVPDIVISSDVNEQQNINKLRIKRRELKKRISSWSLRKLKISGYRGKTYVYGEVIPLKNGKLEGFIYHPNNGNIYVYGEKVNDRIKLFDTSGNSYQMMSR